MENSYSKNSSVITGKFNIYRSCIKSSIEVLKYNKFGLKIILIYLTSIINFNYFIPFSIFHNTTKRKELFSLKGTTFEYVLNSDWWISGLTPFGLFVFVLCLVYGGVQHILCFVFLRLVYPILPVSLDCPFLIAPFGIL